MEHTVDKEKMEALKAIVDANLKISEAKNVLFKLQETETEYLEAREKKALERIGQVIADSRGLLDEVRENYQEIQEVGRGASELVASLNRIHTVLSSALELFEERNVLWSKQVTSQETDIVEVHSQIHAEQVQIENDKRTIEQAKKKLAEEETKINSQWGELDRAIKRLKEGRS